MSPSSLLDIVRRTPKNNCGQCGYPTCLAFAAAVTATGVDHGRCPFLDCAGLTFAAAPAAVLDELARERDLALVDHLKTKIAGHDFAAVAGPLGATWSAAQPDALIFTYLGQQVSMSKAVLLMNGLAPSDPRDQILLYNYVERGGGPLPIGPWIGLESLPNTISKVRTLAVYGEEPLARHLAGLNSGQRQTVAGQLGAQAAPVAGAALGLIVPVLPRLPLYVIFWGAEPEDGFTARVKVLFDEQVLTILDLESLVFCAERLAERVAELAAGV
ncbi:MAG: hypothetical protein A2521_07360 [Deltaproteobacteria bacterium RIFOXYD12_FULL_57_12]|nr:MAG: hypothetical protein A2521_07360 [Deltaproteobacteria bacterium RIFOXYD12_FULL_57_12]